MRFQKSWIILGLVAIVLVGLYVKGVFVPTNVTPTAPQETTGLKTNMTPDLTIDSNGLSKATATLTTTKGVVKFKFYTQDAPATVKRIVELINSGYYNGLTFHRVVPGFVVQGGDPTGTGSGGSGQKLKAEFNDRKHMLGAIAMARTADPNSADSQFYITLGTHPHLDHQYTVFGQVTEGMEVVQKIQMGDKMTTVTIE
ncbi:MAG: peptidylprolyl isomerase [Xanthomonadaceae bacterium]|nr:peptidylprolyl isomerase [Xanthomonadaceae bacterium]